MDFLFLPNKAKDILTLEAAGEEALAVVRSGGSLRGKPGEGYVVAYKDRLFLFSKCFGESSYSYLTGDYGKDIVDITITTEKYNANLNIAVPGDVFTLRLSTIDAFEMAEASKLAEVFSSHAEAATAAGGGVCPATDSPPNEMPPPPTAAPHPPVPEVSSVPKGERASAERWPPNNPAAMAKKHDKSEDVPAMLGMVAAAFFVAACNDYMAPEQEKYIQSLCGGDKTLLENATAYCERHSLDELLAALGHLDQHQKLCLLANLFELAMSDGALHSIEQETLNMVSESLGIDSGQSQTVRDVLLIKNQISVMC